MAKNFKQLSDRVRSDPERAARVDVQKDAIHTALMLAGLRERHQFSQKDLADVLRVSQANVSRIERQQDLYLSTLRAYVEALGGELELAAVFPDERVELAVPTA